ncbi:MAG: hypothetical protein IPG63_15330 [Xanthomonadales bacterium]|nr:hypothetical protein [Xanthomonadales bacterium]
MASERSVDVEIVLRPGTSELIERAEAGDKEALTLLYGHASAFVAAGVPVPAPIAAWLAARLLAVARTVHSRRHDDIGRTHGAARGGGREMAQQLAVDLQVQRAGKKGRPPKVATDRRSESRAREVLHFMEWKDLLPEDAIIRVVEYNMEKKHPVPASSAKSYSAAWQKHGAELMREAKIEFADPKKRK